MYTDNRIEAMLILDKLATLAEASRGFVIDSCVARVYARATCLSVCLFVRPSVRHTPIAKISTATESEIISEHKCIIDVLIFNVPKCCHLAN